MFVYMLSSPLSLCLRADVSYFLCCTRACNKGNRRRLHAGNLSLPFPRYFSPNREPVHRLTITSFTVNGSVNAPRSSCRRKFHGKGIKLKTFAPSCVISFPGVVVRYSRVLLKVPGSSPTPLFFPFSFFSLFVLLFSINIS